MTHKFSRCVQVIPVKPSSSAVNPVNIVDNPRHVMMKKRKRQQPSVSKSASIPPSSPPPKLSGKLLQMKFMSKRKRMLEEREEQSRRRDRDREMKWEAAEKLSSHRSSISSYDTNHTYRSSSSSNISKKMSTYSNEDLSSSSSGIPGLEGDRPRSSVSLRRPRIICIPDDSVGSVLDLDMHSNSSTDANSSSSCNVQGGRGARSFGSFRTRRYYGTEEEEGEDESEDTHINDEKMATRFAKYVGGRNTQQQQQTRGKVKGSKRAVGGLARRK